MALRSAWVVIDADYKNKLFVIEDIANKTGGTTITNDAENVVAYVREHFGKGWRTVYKDTDNEWWEIVPQEYPFERYEVRFKKWHGLAWDILQRQT
jgi:hypothetical protein